MFKRPTTTRLTDAASEMVQKQRTFNMDSPTSAEEKSPYSDYDSVWTYFGLKSIFLLNYNYTKDYFKILFLKFYS